MYINLHTHSDHSNYRLFDATNRVDTSTLFEYTLELGHSGIAITDHESLGGHGIALHTMADLKKKDPEKWGSYKLILGNEIYLCNRKQIQEEKDYTFPHFILLAKNARGHRALRELSTRAWCENSFMWVNMRVPTFYDDLVEVMKDYKGDIVASTACIGGALPRAILVAYNENPLSPNLTNCIKWIDMMIGIFGKENFFLEMQPSVQEEQKIVNKYIIELSKLTGVNYIITTDAHYLKKTDRPIHEAFLNSQDGDRELADFYTTTYVMSEAEIHEYLDEALGAEAVQLGLNNTMLIADMCEEYSLDKPLNIPYIPDNIEEPSEELFNKYKEYIPLLDYFYHSQNDSDRHLTREILNVIENRPEEFQNEKAYKAIQTCLDSIKLSSEKQNTAWSAYLLQTAELIKLCWQSGSLVGCSRGSGCGFVLLYMLGITQVNPLREEVETFHWRFLNPERVSPLDIDVDVQGEMRDTIIHNLQDKYGGYRHVTKVQTILKAKSKNSIQIACRGLGYTSEEGVYLGSFIKAERGLQYSLHQTFYGDEENNILPDREFVALMTGKYADVWEVAQKIEGLCVGTGQHAGGVILCKEDITEDVALMKTKSGDVTTQFDLHMAEACSLIKWDILAIDALGKMKTELELLLEDGRIEWQGTLKDTYEKYLGVYNIERHNDNIWDMIDGHKIISLFQFEKQSGYQAVELGKPRCLEDMAALNSIMRLMPPDPEAKTPLERYSDYKQDISLWYKEMTEYGLTSDEQKFLEKYALKNAGTLANQEDFMLIVQDPKVGGFNLLWADRLRKSIAKKNPKEFVALQEEFYKNMEEKKLSPTLCHYTWDVLVSMNKGYGFNKSHTLGYSIVALQEANLAYHYPVIYWNCANLISDSGGEDGTVNYGKIAAAVGRMRKEGITIVPPYVNETKFGFKPDADNNKIVYGLKAINGVGATQANAIVANQPYASMDDFYNKMTQAKSDIAELTFGDSSMISLIKAGAFDEIENKPREEIMGDFIRKISKPIKRLTMSNIEDLHRLGLLTEEQELHEWRYYLYKKFLYQDKFLAKKAGKSPATFYYKLENKKAEDYFYKTFETGMVEGKDYEYVDGCIAVKRGSLDKVIDKLCEEFTNKVLTNQEFLDIINKDKFNQVWEDKASGTIARWEMDSMNYYYHDHELSNVNRKKYNIVNFDDLGQEPEIEEQRYYNGKAVPRFKLVRLCGTVIDKDANHNTVTLLTPDGVVTVRFYKGQFSFYAKEVAEKDPITNKKTVLEKSWFKRGNMLLVTGVRQGEMFIPRQYKDSIYRHSVQLIKEINDDGTLTLISDRIDANKEEENAISI